MARVNVPVTVVTRAGLAVSETTGDTTDHNSFINDGNTILVIRNSGSTVARTTTIAFGKTVDGQTVTARTVSVNAAATKYVGPFPVDTYGSTVSIDADNAELKYQVIQVQGG